MVDKNTRRFAAIDLDNNFVTFVTFVAIVTFVVPVSARYLDAVVGVGAAAGVFRNLSYHFTYRSSRSRA